MTSVKNEGERVDSDSNGENHKGDLENMKDEPDHLKAKDDCPLLLKRLIDDVHTGDSPGKTSQVSLKERELSKLSKRITDVKDIEELILCCTSCSQQIIHRNVDCIFEHPAIGVLVCKKCWNFYNSGSFSKDENGVDEYCRWCAEGGKLICCDVCTNAFCEACIRRNLGRSALAQIVNADLWNCFVCDPSPLSELRAFCHLVICKTNERKTRPNDTKRQRSLFLSPSARVDPKKGLEACLENTIQLSRHLRHESQILYRKISVLPTDKTFDVKRFSAKVKKLLSFTKDSLDSISRAVDREMNKYLFPTMDTVDPAYSKNSDTLNITKDLKSDASGKMNENSFLDDNNKETEESIMLNRVERSPIEDSPKSRHSKFTASSIPDLEGDSETCTFQNKNDCVYGMKEEDTLSLSLVTAQNDDEVKGLHLNKDPLMSSTPFSKGVRTDHLPSSNEETVREPELLGMLVKDDEEVVGVFEVQVSGGDLKGDGEDCLESHCKNLNLTVGDTYEVGTALTSSRDEITSAERNRNDSSTLKPTEDVANHHWGDEQLVKLKKYKKNKKIEFRLIENLDKAPSSNESNEELEEDEKETILAENYDMVPDSNKISDATEEAEETQTESQRIAVSSMNNNGMFSDENVSNSDEVNIETVEPTKIQGDMIGDRVLNCDCELPIIDENLKSLTDESQKLYEDDKKEKSDERRQSQTEQTTLKDVHCLTSESQVTDDVCPLSQQHEKPSDDHNVDFQLKPAVVNSVNCVKPIPVQDPDDSIISQTNLPTNNVTSSVPELSHDQNAIDKNILAKEDLLKLLEADAQPAEEFDSDVDKKTVVCQKKYSDSPSDELPRFSKYSRLKTTPKIQKRDKNHRSRSLFSSSSSLNSSSGSSSDEHNIVTVKQPAICTSEDKLKLKAIVVLSPLRSRILYELNTKGYMKIKTKRKRQSSESNGSSAESRAVARMCSLRKLKIKRKKPLESCDDDSMSCTSTEMKCEKISSQRRRSQQKPLKSGIISSSSDEESEACLTNPDIATNLKSFEDKTKDDKNKRAKKLLAELLRNSDDENENNEKEDEEENFDKCEETKTKKNASSNSKALLKGDDDNDSDYSDFQPVVNKAKRVTSPLLKAPLGNSDSDSSLTMMSKKTRSQRRKLNTVSHGSSSKSSSSSSEVEFRRKIKTRGRKSNNSNDDSADDSRGQPKKRTKRRRIKELIDSSDDDVCVIDENNQQETTPTGKGRKNIRKLIKDTKLRNDTKFATREEEDRRRRVAELQALYNEVVDKEGKGPHITTKLVLARGDCEMESLVEVNSDLIRKLKPHQVEGVKFLWECVCESMERVLNTTGSGCILAHCMGLGKTLQIITFLHSVLTVDCTKLRSALVVCPLNTVFNWYSEFRTWLDDIEPRMDVIEISSIKTHQARATALRKWRKNGGIVIIGYEMYRIMVQENGKRIPRSCREPFRTTLVDPGPDIVVCDEGHILKNCNTAISKAMNRIRTKRRIVLTGTPLQNNLSEYHCMVNFVKSNLLGTMKEFQNRFVNPIQNGQCADSTAGDVRLMKRRAHILHDVLDGCVQRRDYAVLTPFLPPKHEFVISVKLTEPQVKMYSYYLEHMARRTGKSSSLFADYQALLRIWTHPYVLRLFEIREENKAKSDSESSFIDDNSIASSDSDNSVKVVCDDGSDEPVTSSKKRDETELDDEEVINTWKSRTRGGNDNARLGEQETSEEPESVQNWWMEFVPGDALRIELGGKFVIVFDILKECYAIGDKVLLFSQSLLTLDFLEDLLHKTMEDNREGISDTFYCGNWINGIDYFRLDGSTSAELRSKYMRKFNDKDDLMARLFLISTRAGSLGINLVAANRVIMLDASWNPTHDVQSIFRVYRFGQEKPVYIYRLLAYGTMEEKIYDRQVTKQSLACRVIDEQQIERHFSFADLQELYTLKLDNVNKRPTPMVPKDRLLAELLIKHKEIIVAYHEHDSLLVNQEQEELTEDERSAAWVEFEAEKQGFMESFGNPLALGCPQKYDIHKIIQDIQEKHPGLGKMELKAKFHETLALLNSARQQAMEKQRQELILRQKQALAMQVREAQLANQPSKPQFPYSYPGIPQLPVQVLQNFVIDGQRANNLVKVSTTVDGRHPYPVEGFTKDSLSAKLREVNINPPAPSVPPRL